MTSEFFAERRRLCATCYGKTPGFKQTVTAENARTCPDYQEYIGQIVNGLETVEVMALIPSASDVGETDSFRRPPVESSRQAAPSGSGDYLEAIKEMEEE